MTFIIIFIFGLVVGSFLNAVIHRLHTGQSIVYDRSSCVHCHHKLSAIDLIPVVSFFALGGKCRYCRKPISWQYPIVEIGTATSFVLVYMSNAITLKAGIQDWILGSLQFGGQASPRMTNLAEIIFQLIFVSFLIVIFVYDLKHYLILDKVVFLAAGLALVYQTWQGNVQNALLGAGLLSGFFLLLYLVSKGRWIGFGDVKLGIFLGLLVPFPETIILFFLAYIIGAVVSVFLVSLKIRSMKDPVPFGTFLTFGAFIAMLWGRQLVEWYFRIIGFNL